MAIRTIAVLGAGTMGHGIAHGTAVAGYETRLYDVSEAQLAKARGQIQGILTKSVELGKLAAAEVEQIGADKINERGHHFHYALGQVREFSPEKAETISRVWAIQVASPELAALRKGR